MFCQAPAYSVSIEADMTEARCLLEAAKSRQIRLTCSHLIVRAAALALARNPDPHQMVCGNRVYRPSPCTFASFVPKRSFSAERFRHFPGKRAARRR
jgi:hypothetical protein